MPRAQHDPQQTRELRWLGHALASLRQQAGFTQRSLAEKAGRQFSQIADIERGASSPGWLLLVDLCRHLDANMAELGAAFEQERASDEGSTEGTASDQ